MRTFLRTAAIALAFAVPAGLAHAQTSADADLDAAIKKADQAAIAEGGAGPEGRARVGVLSCEIEGGIGLIVGSSKGVSCSFEDASGTETYEGRIGKLGLDIGVTGTQYMRWVVFAAEGVDATDALTGTYAGVSAAGTLGVGFGANALVGGSQRSVVLQPISVQAGTGLNVAIGVARLTLDRT